jgi:hypothetical protein
MEEPLAGTASEAAGWLLVEQEPPWGHEALLESGLDSVVGDELLRRAKAVGAKVVLVRRPGSGGRPAHAGLRRVLAACAGPEGFVQSLELTSDDALLDLDLGRLAVGERLPGGREVSTPLVLVCTNGRRDACCAREGSRAVSALQDRWPELAWECSHLGGHRFAATMLCLPSGACYGRLDPAAAVEAVAALERGELFLSYLRGIVGRPPAVQAAEAILREEYDLREISAVRPLGQAEVGQEAEVSFATPFGEQVVRVVSVGGDQRRVSCTGEPEPVQWWLPATPAGARSTERW